jgi:hypothetical protein
MTKGTRVRGYLHKISKNYSKLKKGGIMDDAILYSEILEVLAKSDLKASYIDVPLKKIVGLREKNEKNFYEENSTWRDVVLGLHCNDWDKYAKSIAIYFRSDDPKGGFPTPKITGDMRLGKIGNIYFCTHGAHRMVAAKVWLSFIRGEGTDIKNINTSSYSITKSMREFIKNSLANDYTLKVFYAPNYIKIIKDSTFELYKVDERGDLIKAKKWHYFWFKVKQIVQLKKHSFQEVPNSILRQML